MSALIDIGTIKESDVYILTGMLCFTINVDCSMPIVFAYFTIHFI